MSLETRSNSALFKRAEQLKRWEDSDTNREPVYPKQTSRKIKFSSGCVFLAACAAGDKDEVLKLLENGADINTANVDGLTALHQDVALSDRKYRREPSQVADRKNRSRASEKSRSRSSDRGRDYHSSSRRKRSRSGSRLGRKSEERRTRDHDRLHRDDDLDCKHSSNKAVTGACGSEIVDCKRHPPNNTILIRGLALYISENDIRQDITECGLTPKDVRLIRNKATSASRGFAFVEFSTLSHAKRWMDMKQGILFLQGHHRAIMQYSNDESAYFKKTSSDKASSNWLCSKCNSHNFQRRYNCFSCHASRTESEEGIYGSNEICTYTTKTIMIRNLDGLTTEDSVMSVLNTIIPDLIKLISAVCIGRDPLTCTSCGICYLGTESTIDASAIYGALTNSTSPLVIDGKKVILSYSKYSMGDHNKPYYQADNDSIPGTDIESLAEYAAKSYANSPNEYVHYVEYYRHYYTQQMSSDNSISVHQKNKTYDANAAAAVAQAAIQQMNANKKFCDSTHVSIPNGTNGKIYPLPDISKYAYVESSGYQFDASTGLYYDPNSNYYWNSVIQKYLYYDQEKLTYVLAPMNYDNPATHQATVQEVKKPKTEKRNKVTVAKKIVKDMEKWAKTWNQKKEMSSARASGSYSASVDIGFSVKKGNTCQFIPGFYKNEEPEELIPCSAAHREGIDLTKRAKFSTLHNKNLEARKKIKRFDNPEKQMYRDRAKERRTKYGDVEPQSSELKEKFLKSRELAEIPVAVSSVSDPIGVENIGNRLLQKMGWVEGQGLGKQNQGRTTIIEAERYNSIKGLGNKRTDDTIQAGSSYKDCVKKIMYGRYQELTEKEK